MLAVATAAPRRLWVLIGSVYEGRCRSFRRFPPFSRWARPDTNLRLAVYYYDDGFLLLFLFFLFVVFVVVVVVIVVAVVVVVLV